MKKTLEGKIVSVKMGSVAVVEVKRKIPHPIYKKLINKSKKYKAQVGEHSISLGNKVRIVQTRPTSKDTHFKIMEVVK